jgi:Uma2 family endonuclease
MEATRFPPDLAVEVLSRSTEARDRGRKMRLLAASGVPEYWIVDPVADVLEIYVLGREGYELSGAYVESEDVQSPTLPALSFATGRIFAE